MTAKQKLSLLGGGGEVGDLGGWWCSIMVLAQPNQGEISPSLKVAFGLKVLSGFDFKFTP